MTDHKFYIFSLCLSVSTLLIGTSIWIIFYIIQLRLKLIRCGEEDKEIYLLHRNNQKKRAIVWIDRVISTAICVMLLIALIFSVYINAVDNGETSVLPRIRVVQSASMETKHKNNDYLVQNNLNNQIATFDLIITHPVKRQEELQLYDIVVYQSGKDRIIHRIVEIIEPTTVTGERSFICQGDANPSSDPLPVHYSEICGVYRGDRIPFIGSFVFFMKSPAGWICIIVALMVTVGSWFVERSLEKEKQKRLSNILNDGIIKND